MLLEQDTVWTLEEGGARSLEGRDGLPGAKVYKYETNYIMIRNHLPTLAGHYTT